VTRESSHILLLSAIILTVLAAGVAAAVSQSGCDCNAAKAILPEDKLVRSAEIYKGFEEGQEKVEVIVNLNKPQELLKTINWHSKSSLENLHSEIKSRQGRALAKLAPSEYKLRHKFENQASFSAEVTLDGLYKLMDDPNVVSIEPVYQLYEHLAQGIPLMNGTVYRSSYNGQGVAIAICDTGVDYTHPMLGGGGFPNSKVIGGYDFGDNDSNPMPGTDAHGTCTAGIAAGSLGSVGDYIGGVAYGAKIYALKVENTSGVITNANVAAAWDWCVSHKNDNPSNPILVISTSLGSGKYTSACDGADSSIATAANNVVAAGITLLASSGNDGYCDSIALPACMSSVISVGAVYDADFGTYPFCISSATCATKLFSAGCSTRWYANDATAADKVTSYSNTASFLNLLAPSDMAYTTDIVGAGGYSSGDYYPQFGGTSASSPYAAGAVACLQSAAKAINGNYLTPAQVKSILASTGNLITDGKTPITKPRINIGNAIESLGFLNTPVLHAEPAYTSGLCNTISWSAVADANKYYAQRSSVSNFSVIDSNSDWISATSFQFCGLVSGQTYYYRVKARNQYLVESGWSNVVSSRQCSIPGDFEPDCDVDFNDLMIMASQWLQSPGTPSADINQDGTVNFSDFAVLANHWLQGTQ
jgi:subtilisin family serine protease